MTLRGFLDLSRLGRLFVLCGVIWLAGPTWTHAVPQGEWVATGSPMSAASGPIAILPDGRAAVFSGGGAIGSLVQVYRPETGDWVAAGSLQVLTVAGTATLLPSGRVLLAGGVASSGSSSAVTAVAELYNPATGVSNVTAPMHFARTGHRATLLASGKVLISGGMNADGQSVGPAEIYDPVTQIWAITGVLNNFRSGHGAERLANGKVLVVGGFGDASSTSAELYDPTTGTWAFTGSPPGSLSSVETVTLTDGRILAVGGPAALYNPSNGTWLATGPIPNAGGNRAGLVVLRDGTPLLGYGSCFHGFLSGGCFLDTAALFDVQTIAWIPSAPLPRTPAPARSINAGGAVLPDGRALFITIPPLLFRPDNTTPRLTVSPSSLDFGKTSPGSPVQHSLTLQNTGGAVLTGSVASPSTPFGMAAPGPFTLAPGQGTTALVSFNPAGFGTFSNTLQVASNGNWVSVPLTGGAGVLLSGRVTDGTGAGVAGVAVNLTGAATDTTGTDATGHYRLFVPPNNGYNVTPAGPGLTFTPSTRSRLVGTQDVSGLDFAVAFSPTHLGIFRNGLWFLDLNGNAQWDGCAADGCLPFGAPGDKPIAGDWSGTGKTRIGVFRNGIWSLDYNGSGLWDGCTADRCPTFGQAGDEPVVGDWARAGHTSIGVFRNGAWFLDVNGNGQWDGCATDACLAFGQVGDVPVVGDWAGTGAPNIGVFRNGLWFLDRNGNGQFDGCGVDICVAFGQAGDLPVVGDWTGTGVDRIGVFRDGGWYLDLNGNGQWDGCIVDACIGFGQAGDRAVIGYW